MAKKEQKTSIFSKLLSKTLVLIVVTLVVLIVLKSNPELKNYIKEKTFQNSFNFAKINEIYKKYFGSSLPLKDNTKTELVAAEKLEYSKIEDYKDGAKLTVKENYLVPALDSGIVIFIGEKEGYGNTIIIQTSDNTEVWYANIDNNAVSMYDYVKKGQTLGQAKDKKLYLVFTKEGKNLDYKNKI